MYSPLHKFGYHSTDHWGAVEAYVCSRLCISVYNITNPGRIAPSSQYVLCPFLTPSPQSLLLQHLTAQISELWLVLALTCTLLTSNMTWYLQPPSVCFNGRDSYKKSVCDRKGGGAESPLAHLWIHPSAAEPWENINTAFSLFFSLFLFSTLRSIRCFIGLNVKLKKKKRERDILPKSVLLSLSLSYSSLCNQ